ncbi:MAG TPA: type III secretion system chaperone [Planctomycetaceae bacterium]|nr:type III secretion system chaperone [Planctomycetaceae bacterium]
MRKPNRNWWVVGGLVLASSGVLAAGQLLRAADQEAPSTSAAATESSTIPGHLSQDELGTLIRAMGIQVKLDERRFDFSFPATYNKEPWTLSMSAVLSENGNSIWVMAWLDQCPKTAAEVPRTALLRLLAKNDTLGNGKFFAYIPANTRFVLERVLPNENMTTARFREVLQDLGAAVVETYPYWSVANWTKPAQPRPTDSMPQGRANSSEQPPTDTQRGESQRGGGEPAGYRGSN